MRLNVEDFRLDAKKALPRFAFDYVDGAAETNSCARRNKIDLDGIQLMPRVLRDTSSLDTRISVFGDVWKRPYAVAPMGFNGLTRPGGDVILARAAAAHGIPFVLSTASNERLEAVADSGGVNWLQVYVMKDRSIAAQMVRRAKQSGYKAIVLTVDVPVSGYRERDVRNGFRLPFRPKASTLLDLVRHPGWLSRFLKSGMPGFVNLAEDPNASTLELQAALLSREMDRGLVWDSIAWLRSIWDGPLLLKGILNPLDAARAIGAGVDGLIVSNHGGRQLDGAVSSILSLEKVLSAVNGRAPVFVDSGFRSGADISKALCLGARAVFVGRPLLYGLAVDGLRGVDTVLGILAAGLERSMILLGAASVGELDRGLIFREGDGHA